MQSRVGDNVQFMNFDLAGVNLTKDCYINGVKFKNSIRFPLGEVCEVRIIDDRNIIGQQKLNGEKALNQEVNITMRIPYTDSFVDKKFKIMKHNGLDDGSTSSGGNNRHKQHSFLLVREEALNAQANKVNYADNKPATDQIKKIIEDYYKSSDPVRVLEQSQGNLRNVAYGHPLKSIQHLLNRCVGDENSCNCFILFHDGKVGASWNIGTIGYLLNNSPNLGTFNQSVTNQAGASEEQIYRSALSLQVNNLFDTSPAHKFSATPSTYNIVTGYATRDEKQPQDDFQVPNSDKIIGRDGKNNPPADRRTHVRTLNDPLNNQQGGDKIAKSRLIRQAALAQYRQNSGKMRVHINDQLMNGVGSRITLQLPDKSDNGSAGGEPQFNGQCLVAESTTLIFPTGMKPGGFTECTLITGGKNRG